jgi:hypothetical protein
LGFCGLSVVMTACGRSDGSGTDGEGGTGAFGGSTSGAFGGSTSGAFGGSTSGAFGGSTSGAFGGSTSGAFGGSTSATTGTTASAPTWTKIYQTYFATGTAGHCIDCHSFGASATALYTELKASNQINGTNSRLVSNGSILTWFGGIMPEGGSATNPAAVADLKAWVAAGALNN